MTDLSSLSNEQLMALYQAPAQPSSLADMSDDQLKKLYESSKPADFSFNGMDIAKGAGTGLVEGVMGLAGLPADAGSLVGSAVSGIGNKLGVDPDKVATFKRMAVSAGMSNPLTAGPTKMIANGPTSSTIKGVVEGVTGELPQPQTEFGKYAKTAGEFVPAMIGGPESLAVKALTRVVAPTIGTEVGGALTKGTDAEPYGRLAGALLGSAGATKAANTFAEAAAARAAPTTSQVKSAASNTYDALTSRNVATPIAQSELDSLAGDIRTALNNKGVRPSTAGQVHAAVDEIMTPATKGAADVADLVAARQNIKSLLGAPDANKAGAFIALPKLESAIERLSPGTMKDIREADKNWTVFKANEALDKKMARAELRAAGEHSGLNTGNRIRQNVTNYLLSNESKYLSAEQRKELEKVVKGTATQNAIRFASNLLGGGGGLGSTVLGLGSAAAGTYSGHPEASLLPVGGIGLRLASNRLTAGQASKAAAALRSSSPYGQAQNLPALASQQNPLLQGLLSALLASPSGRGVQ